MEVYAEYAFAENFLIDAMLLYVTFRCTKTPARALPVVTASSFGATFAVLYALIALPYALSLCIKIAAGVAMCLLARGGMFKRDVRFFKRNRAQKLRCVRSFSVFTAVFFLLSACLCGMFYAIDATGKALKAWQIPVCVFFAFACESGAKRLFKEQKIARFTRTCILYAGDAGDEKGADGAVGAGVADKTNGVRVRGFIDSGNRAVTPEGVPICFIPPSIALSLLNENVRMRDFSVSTVGGEKKIKIFKGAVLIYEGCEAHKIKRAYFYKVYFSPSAHLSGDRVLLPADCLNETTASERHSGGKEDTENKKGKEGFLSEAAIGEAKTRGGAENGETIEKTNKNNDNDNDKAQAEERGEKR